MKRTRKGFTLVELLIVVAIIGVLASMMSISAGSSTATAKASTIYSNLRNIKMIGLMYQVQKGDAFKESDVNETNLKTAKLLDLSTYNKTGTADNNVQYHVEEGSGQEGAYVICKFVDDNDRKAIAQALKGYKDIRINGDDEGETDYTVGAFIYHPTPATYDSEATDNEEYDRAFSSF